MEQPKPLTPQEQSEIQQYGVTLATIGERQKEHKVDSCQQKTISRT